VDALPGQQPEVIRARYQGDMTMEAIGQQQGVTRQAVRQTIANGLRELRRPRNAKQLRPFIDVYITCYAYRGNGVGAFNRTWTS